MGRGEEEKERVKVNASEEKGRNWGSRDEMMEETTIFGERDGRRTTRIPRDLPAAGLACGLSYLSDDAAQPGGSKNDNSTERQTQKRRRTRRGQGRGPCRACTGTGAGTGVASGRHALFLAVGRSLRRAMGCPELWLL